MKLTLPAAISHIAVGSVSASAFRRALLLALAIFTLLLALVLVQRSSEGQEPRFLPQLWAADDPARAMTTYLCAVTSALIAVAALAGQEAGSSVSLLLGAGLLAAIIVWRSLLASFLLLLLPLLVPAPIAGRQGRSAMQASSQLVAWLGIAVLCVPTVIILLERTTALPESLHFATWSAWLMLPPVLVWLNLFPADGFLRLWSREEQSLWPAFLWAARDPVVVYLLLSLWHQQPVLQARLPMAALGAGALATAVFNGVLAMVQTSPSGLLACVALSQLGIAVQGLASGVQAGVLGGMALIVDRSAAVLLASTSLAAMRHLSGGGTASHSHRAYWRKTLALTGFAVSVLAMAGAPWGALGARTSVLAALHVQTPYMLLTWACAWLTVALGLARIIWNLWHEDALPSSGKAGDLLLVLVLGLIVLTVLVGSRYEAATPLLSRWFGDLLPALD